MFLVQNNMTIKWGDMGNRYCLHILRDDLADDPRSDDGNISTMACWHPRHNLGDDIDKMQPDEFWKDLVRKNVPESDISEAAIAGKLSNVSVKMVKGNPGLYDIHLKDWGKDFNGLQKGSIAYYVLDELSTADCQALLHPYAEWLPLWLYEHSGITMSCGKCVHPYSDKWDSGQIGIIIVLKNKIVSEFGLDPNKDEDWRSRAVKMMEDEVRTYDQYLTDDVYWFNVHKFIDDGTKDGHWEDIESCSGFYGDDLMENGMLESVGYNLKAAIESNQYETGTATRHVVEYWTF